MGAEKLSLDEVLARLRPSTFSMIRHFADLSIDPHKQSKEFRAAMISEIKFAFTGECDHAPSNIMVAASGDFSARVANGVYCRGCGQRLKPKVIVWELEDALPSPPMSA